MKKFLQIFALCALCVLVAPMVFAQNDEPVITATKDNFFEAVWSIEKSGTIKLVGEIDSETIEVINERMENVSLLGAVVRIGIDMSKTTGLKYIPEDAFRNNLLLVNIMLPENLETIGRCAFFECEMLASISIPNSVERIEEGAFIKCRHLKSITIPESVKIIETRAFAFCDKLEKITLPDGLKSIAESTFLDCKKLKSITIPDSIENIGAQAFWDCKKLKTINYKGSKEQWDAINKGQYWNECCPSTMKINFNYQE